MILLCRYIKYVTQHLGPIETLLRVVMVPTEPRESLVENYLILFANNDITNFQKVLELKVRLCHGNIRKTTVGVKE